MSATKSFIVTQLRCSASSCVFPAGVQKHRVTLSHFVRSFYCFENQKLPSHYKTPVCLFCFLLFFISSFTAASPKGFGGARTSFLRIIMLPLGDYVTVLYPAVQAVLFYLHKTILCFHKEHVRFAIYWCKLRTFFDPVVVWST